MEPSRKRARRPGVEAGEETTPALCSDSDDALAARLTALPPTILVSMLAHACQAQAQHSDDGAASGGAGGGAGASADATSASSSSSADAAQFLAAMRSSTAIRRVFHAACARQGVQDSFFAVHTAPAPATTAATAAALPPGWEKHMSKSQKRPYYANTYTKERLWQRPPVGPRVAIIVPFRDLHTEQQVSM